jgi:hypothetical protein
MMRDAGVSLPSEASAHPVQGEDNVDGAILLESFVQQLEAVPGPVRSSTFGRFAQTPASYSSSYAPSLSSFSSSSSLAAAASSDAFEAPYREPCTPPASFFAQSSQPSFGALESYPMQTHEAATPPRACMFSDWTSSAASAPPPFGNARVRCVSDDVSDAASSSRPVRRSVDKTRRLPCTVERAVLKLWIYRSPL